MYIMYHITPHTTSYTHTPLIHPTPSHTTSPTSTQALHSRYIMESGDEGIGCPLHVVGVITSHLWPAYEDLFDEAEEHALQMLLGQWVGLCNNEDFIFQKVGHLGFFLLKSGSFSCPLFCHL